MLDPKKKVDNLIGLVSGTSASAQPTSSLYQAIHVEPSKEPGYVVTASPLPPNDPLAFIGCVDTDTLGTNPIVDNADGKAWYVDYYRMLEAYINSSDWALADGKNWRALAATPRALQSMFSSPRQAAMASLGEPMVQRRIIRYGLANESDLAERIEDAVSWERRLHVISQALARSGWKPGRIGLHAGTDTVFAIGECGGEIPSKVMAIVHTALGEAGLVTEDLRVARRGTSSGGPWQASFSLLHEEDDDFEDIRPEDIATPAIEQHPGMKSANLAHSIARSLKTRVPAFSSLTLDTTSFIRDKRGWPMLRFFVSVWEKWPMWGSDVKPGESPVVTYYSTEDIIKAIKDTCAELGLVMYPYPHQDVQVIDGISIEKHVHHYSIVFLTHGVEYLSKSPLYQIGESKSPVKDTEGSLDHQYLSKVRDVLEKDASWKMLIASVRPTEYPLKESILIRATLKPRYPMCEREASECVESILKDANLCPKVIFCRMQEDGNYGVSWRMKSHDHDKDRREIIICESGINPADAPLLQDDQDALGDLSKFKRLVGMVMSNAPRDMELSQATSRPTCDLSRASEFTARIETQHVDVTSISRFILDSMDMLNMHPVHAPNPFSSISYNGYQVSVRIPYTRDAMARKTLRYDADNGASIDDKFQVSEADESGLDPSDVEWARHTLSKVDPWWNDRRRVLDISTELHNAGFDGDVTLFVQPREYSARSYTPLFGTFIVHLRALNPEEVKDRKDVCARVNSIFQKFFDIDIQPYSIREQYEGKWKHSSREDRRSHIGWYTILIGSVTLRNTPKKGSFSPETITIAIGESEDIQPSELWRSFTWGWKVKHVESGPMWYNRGFYVYRGAYWTPYVDSVYYGPSAIGIQRFINYMEWLEATWQPVGKEAPYDWLVRASKLKKREEFERLNPPKAEDILGESAEIDPADLWKSHIAGWRIKQASSEESSVALTGYYIYKGDSFKDSVGSRLRWGNDPKGIERAAHYMNWLEREWEPYVYGEYIRVSDWLDIARVKGKEKEYVKLFPEAATPDPMQEDTPEEKIDPWELLYYTDPSVQERAMLSSLAAKIKSMGYTGGLSSDMIGSGGVVELYLHTGVYWDKVNYPDIAKQEDALLKERAEGLNKAVVDLLRKYRYEVDTLTATQGHDFNWATDNLVKTGWGTDLYAPKEDNDSYIEIILTGYVLFRRPDYRGPYSAKSFRSKDKKMTITIPEALENHPLDLTIESMIQDNSNEEMGVDMRDIYNQAFSQSLAATKAPLKKMADHLKGLGYTGTIRIVPSLFDRPNNLHTFILIPKNVAPSMTPIIQSEEDVDAAIEAAGYQDYAKKEAPGNKYYTIFDSYSYARKGVEALYLKAQLPILGPRPLYTVEYSF
jgi:hypothetical protein